MNRNLPTYRERLVSKLSLDTQLRYETQFRNENPTKCTFVWQKFDNPASRA